MPPLFADEVHPAAWSGLGAVVVGVGAWLLGVYRERNATAQARAVAAAAARKDERAADQAEQIDALTAWQKLHEVTLDDLREVRRELADLRRESAARAERYDREIAELRAQRAESEQRWGRVKAWMLHVEQATSAAGIRVTTWDEWDGKKQ